MNRSLQSSMSGSARSVMSTAGSRRGFTLLELTLALGLTIVLMTAVYRAMEIHWQFSVAGQIEVERSQIARALLSKIAADIRSTVYREPDVSAATSSSTTDSTDTSTDSTSSDSDTTVVEYTDPADAFSSNSTGVFGDGQSLVLHISRPMRAKESPSGDPGSGLSQSDLKSVSYFLAGGEASVASMVSGPLSSKQTDDGIEGLSRMSGDRFALIQSTDAGDTPDVASQTELLAPEVNYLSFEYHDGYEWLTEWDSAVERRLPNAIGVTIGFRAPDFPENSFLRRTASESTDTFRIVVPLSAANPFEGVAY
ncbi:hypothetical protein GC176_27250 [bacterium]|nr:hypothetical protein [bacterium]